MAVSALRTIRLPEYEGQTIGLQWPLLWPPKDPQSADLDYSLDVSKWLMEIQDTIATANVHWGPYIRAGDLAVYGLSVSNGIITILTSGGLPFNTYTVTMSVTTAIAGLNLVRSILLPVNAVGASMDVSGTASVSGVFN